MSKKKPTPALPKSLRSPMSKKKPTPALPKSLRSPMSKTPPPTMAERATSTQPSNPTNPSTSPKPSDQSPTIGTQPSNSTNLSTSPKPSDQSPTIGNMKEEVPENKASANPLAGPFSLYQQNLANAKPQPVRWLWQNRLPLGGFTLLDGDHGCGKSLLALQLAAHVSSGTPMLDEPPTTRGGVVIITPDIDAATTQLQLLTSLGADLSRIEILSYIRKPETSSHASGYRPFALPQDLPRLFEAVERINARLIILDPFIDLLSHDQRWTDQRLGHLLADLNQHLIERQIACLLIRNCPAKGGSARPSVLERSERFLRIARSRLLLTPDPIQPDHLLLTHARSTHTALTPTLILCIQRRSSDPALASITMQGTHSLPAKDFIENRPDTLHRRLLSQHLLSFIAATTNPIPVATLYAHSPHSSPFQIQRSLRDLLNMGQIERPARGFYSPSPTNPVFKPHTTSATTPDPQKVSPPNSSPATTPAPQESSSLDPTPTTTPDPQKSSSPDAAAATTPDPQKSSSLDHSPAITPAPQKPSSLDPIPTTTPDPQPAITTRSLPHALA